MWLLNVRCHLTQSCQAIFWFNLFLSYKADIQKGNEQIQELIMLSHWKTLVIKRLSGLIKLKGFSMNCALEKQGLISSAC